VGQSVSRSGISLKREEELSGYGNNCVRPQHSELLLTPMRTILTSSGSQVPQRDMLGSGMVGSIEWVVSHEKVFRRHYSAHVGM